MSDNNTRRVVVGIDGSPDSLTALNLAADEAQVRGVPLDIVYGFVPIAVYAPFAPPVIPGADKAARGMVEEVADRVRHDHPDLSVRTQVLTGGGAAVLISESKHADLVVVGCRGRDGFIGLLAGSVSTQVAAHAACPVIVVRPEHIANRHPQGHVVVGVDASPGCAPAVEFAFTEASRRGVPLTAIHIWSHLPVTELTAEAPIAYSYAQAHEDAARVVAESIAGWSEKYPDVEVRQAPILAENARNELVKASEHASMVVVGSRGRGQLAGALLGSVGYTLVHSARCPVAIVR